MKNISIKFISILVLMTMTLSSCLKDLEDYLGAFQGAPQVAEILNRPSPATGLTLIGFVDPNVKINVTITISIGGEYPPSVPTTITMALDNALITAYNTQKGLTGLDAGIPVPAAAETFTSMDVTVPANVREAEFKFQIDPTKIVNPAALNIIPLKIGSTDNSNVVISGNFGTALVQILGRNKWDGIYTVTGTFVDYVNAAFGPYYPKTVHLETASAYTCLKWDADEEMYGYIFDAAYPSVSLSYFGNWTPYFKFDASDNVIDCINSTSDAAPRSRTAALYTGAGSINKYDPVAKTLDVSYQLKQMNVTPNLRNLIMEHYVYVGPRPE